ncbi:twin-arginine translocation signal domain-containing protein [Micromonospora echinospora]|uniref:twin-arginine translocation signal domain-containing protein n=1 Tax=Micromonospora echinospora TaxID=1877 RepID=UPI0034326045
MHLTRRHLLGATAAAGVTGLATGCEPERPAAQDGAADDPPALDPASWDSVRAQFALDRSRAHLATFVFAPHPAPVRAAVATHRDGLDRDASGYLLANEDGWTARCSTRPPGTSARIRTRSRSPTPPPWASALSTAPSGCGRATRC